MTFSFILLWEPVGCVPFTTCWSGWVIIWTVVITTVFELVVGSPYKFNRFRTVIELQIIAVNSPFGLPLRQIIVFYILSLFFNENFVIDFVVTISLVALDFWVVKNVSGRILVGLIWWNEINDRGESIWRFECLDQESLARMNKKDSWLFWWTLYVAAIIWSALGIMAIIKFNIDYLLVDGIFLTLTMANIIGFTKCKKDAKKQIQYFASQTFGSHVSSTLQLAFGVV